jgi:hypothetical protein
VATNRRLLIKDWINNEQVLHTATAPWLHLGIEDLEAAAERARAAALDGRTRPYPARRA